MKIKSLYPALITSKSEETIEFMKKSGFFIVHKRNDLFEPGETEYVLENTAGNRMDIVSVPSETTDSYAVRINVDNFEDALQSCIEDGFTVLKGPNTKYNSKNTLLRSQNNMLVFLMQHISE